MPDDAPATVGDVRNLKRWLIVAGVWAVAASAIAIIALIKANDNEPRNTPNAVTGSQLSGVQRDLDQRIDDLDQRIDDLEKKIKTLPSSNDLSNLDDRLKAVEKKADGATSDVKATRSDAADLKKRVDDLEQQQKQAGSNTTTTP